MPAAVKKLLLDNLTKLDTLTPAQRTLIVGALLAYQFSPGSDGETWRDALVDSIQNGHLDTAGLAAIAIANGTVVLQACS